MSARTLVFLILIGSASVTLAETVSYELFIGQKTIDFTGEAVAGLAINDQIPAPTLEATVGDTLQVTFHNQLDEVTTVHWHGILLPPDQDGVAYLNTMPIAPGGSHTFEFPIIHAGTFWYHSHTDMQIQKGLYGAVVLHGGLVHEAIPEQVVVFSDWTNEPMGRVLSNLKSDDDYYSFMKGTTQSWNRVIANGGQAIRNRLGSAFTRMGPMDLADVYYDAFLVNGETVSSLPLTDHAASQMKLRLVNGSTSSYFDVEYAGGPMTVIAADGQDVVPIAVQRLRMSTAETYDVLIPVSHANAFELRATSFDGMGFSSLFVGEGPRISAPDIPSPNLYLMSHSGSHAMQGMQDEVPGDQAHIHQPDPDAADVNSNSVASGQDHGNHGVTADSGATATEQNQHVHPTPGAGDDMAVIPHLMDYESLVALQPTTLPADRQWRELSMTLSGAMERYIWGFDNRTMRESPQILIREGENVRIHLTNDTMMHHPIHLHGHFFRVINQHGERSPLKHTVNVPPMGSVTIEFTADEARDWLFHCHNQYHMKSGMNRVVSYQDSSILTAAMNRQIQPHQRWFDVQEFHLMSSFADYEYSIFDERHEFRFEIDLDLVDTYETHFLYAYHFNRLVSAFVGMENREHHHDENHDISIAGFNLLLPMMIESEWRADDHGRFRAEFESEVPLTPRLGIDWRWNTDNEYRYGLNLRLNSRWSMTLHTDSEYGDGVGIKFFY